MFDDQRAKLLSMIDAAHDAYYKAETFNGPSLYFHLKSLKWSRERDFEHFAECIYALLTSWGMHRMGQGGSKMREFDEFRSSLQHVWPAAMQLQERSPGSLIDSDWAQIKSIFCNISCMASATSLVGNSKVMAHLIPNLIPPVDREYTLKFLFGHGQITNGIEGEWTKLLKILTDFFYPISYSVIFQAKAADWLARSDQFKWDTSPLKIIDNLVIGAAKMERTVTSVSGKIG